MATMQHPPQPVFTASPIPIQPPTQPSSAQRALPDRSVSSTSIEDAYAAFVLYCNPGVPIDTDSTALREAFRTPPKSGGKSFSTYTLFELIKKLETKELKTWAELALKLGVEPPDQEKGQSSQKIQQYAVRLKRWMHSMHVDAFFEYLIGRQSPYWTEIPPEHVPVAELERDGVAAEDDMALRALLPQIKPRRGKRKPEDDETGKSPSQRPSPQAEEDGTGGPANTAEPWTAQPDGRGSVFLFPPVPDPSRLNPSAPSWTNEIVQTPMTAYPIPQSAITPSTRNAFWADEPRSALTPSKPRSASRRHGAKVVSSAWRSGTATPVPIGNAAPPAPLAPPPPQDPAPQPTQTLNHFSPIQESAPARPAKRRMLSLQVPERKGGEVRLATPPLPEPATAPVVMINGQTAEPHGQPMPGALGVDQVGPMHAQIPGVNANGSLPLEAAISGGLNAFTQDPTDRTNVAEVDALFVSSLLDANWYDANQQPIAPCSVEEALAFSQTVVETLRNAAPTHETFLINLSGLAGGQALMRKGSLRVTRVEELADRTRYSVIWQLQYGGIVGDWNMEETVLHEKWKKPKKDDGAAPLSGSATPTGAGGSQAENWKRMYTEMAATLQRRDEEVVRLKPFARSVPHCPTIPDTIRIPLNPRSNSYAMPKQYVLCGRPLPRFGTRRISLLLVFFAIFAVFSLLFTLPGSIQASPKLRAAGNRFSIPKSFKSPWMNKLNPFKQPTRPPRVQKTDTDGDSVWHADWNWLLMPFSSSITLDENRALLPMLKDRTPIYCYYDNTVEKDRSSSDAESALLLTWRRAWWAQGFKPVILSPAEAMNNPLYEELQKLDGMTPKLKEDLMRWLAWENMGDGVLAHHLVFPMGPHDDPLFAYLRRGEFPKLTRFKDLDDGLFVGSMTDVTDVIKTVMNSPESKQAEGIVALLESGEKENPFSVDNAPKALAYYSAHQVETLYPELGDDIAASHAAGLKSLTQLISAHLHLTWQNIFTSGIAVVKPLPHHTTHLITPAYELAQRLAHCPESPLPNTCPPNRPKCRPCDDSKPMKIGTPSSYSGVDTLYTIGTVPHPYTSSTLNYLKTQLSIPWIRRDSPRDAWVTSLTSSLFTDSVSTTPRLISFKEAVASDEDDTTETKGTVRGTKGGAYRSLWLPAEQTLPDDLDWHFGFALPDRATYAADQSTPDSTPDSTDTASDTTNDPPSTVVPLHTPKDGPVPTADELALEPALFTRAQAVVLSSSSRLTLKAKASAEDLALRNAVEAWNLADTEAWRFARAYLARKSVERAKWEDEEARYAGGVGAEKSHRPEAGGDGGEGGKKGAGGKKKGGGKVWDRWLDRD
ncbi:ARS binding protein 2-domain-containing protein [Chaetomium fimeti]|uniref:ARS binding protein 2-domain-containing protein n=1 Tax=Chaetomium fimeti TaxID=1854472 RepID=A0AAE0LUQ4_9PEZI|nr:ARS binding protein 2-domain-containing protein [Chaetomium fimeti]